MIDKRVENDKMHTFVSIVVYVRNMEKYLGINLDTIYKTISQTFKEFEFILVDDASDDNSIEVIKAFANKALETCSIRLIELGYFHGVESAMQAGHDMAIGDFIYEFDYVFVDYPPSLIIDVYNKVLEGFDIVAAKPKKLKSWQSKIFYKLINSMLFLDRNTISTESFRVLSRRGLNRVQAISRRMQYRKLVYESSGLRTTSIMYSNDTINNNGYDAQNYKKRKMLAVDTLIVFTDIAYKVSLLFSTLMAVLMLGFGIYTVIIYFGIRQPVEGWVPIMGLISAGFFGMFAILTIIIKYLDILIKNVFDRHIYRIRAVNKIK